MLELTQAQRAALERAKYRQQFTPPAPWSTDSTEPSNWYLSDGKGRKLLVIEAECGVLPTHWATKETIEAAATLQEISITQAKIIEEQARRITLLENELRLQTGSIDIWTVE